MPIHNRYQHETVEGVRVGRFNKGINTTFIVYRFDDTLIDCGPTNQWSAVKPFVAEKSVRQLLLTHHHEDHSGNACDISRQCNITPLAPQLAIERLANGYSIPPIQKLIWGTLKPVNTQPYPDDIRLSDGSEVLPIHTPGHADDLHCFYIPQQGWLFSGDLYISKSLRYLRREENLFDLMRSINKVLQLDFEVVFCPHRGILQEGKSALKGKLDNLKELVEQIQDKAARGMSEKSITKAVMGGESMFTLVTLKDFSKLNLVRQALKVDLNKI